MKKVICIGGGLSSSLFAYQVKKNHPSYKVIILEKDEKILKRVLISGNGRCNFFNGDFLNGSYPLRFNFPSKVKELISENTIDEFIKILKYEFNFSYYSDSSLRYYPFSNSSSSFRDILIKKLNEVGVETLTNSKVVSISPKNKTVNLESGNLNYDYIFIGIGGKAYDRDINENILSNLNIDINPYESCLCPLYTKNKYPSLDGVRIKGILHLLINSKEVYKEEGELLFKKDGISGICIFNSSLFINEKSKNVIKFNPLCHDNVDLTEIYREFNYDNLVSIFPDKLVKLLLKNREKLDINELLNFFTFEIKGKYPLKNSQISLGGISLNEIDNNFRLNKHQNIFVGGEIIDLHAICGGYNIGFALLSALRASKSVN